MSNQPFRILSLDGGGIRGFYSAALLDQLEESTNKAIKDYFDLIVGTSTGAIIALGLASGMSASDILQFYRTHGLTVFSKPRRIRSLLRPKYDNTQLKEALHNTFGEKTLNDLEVPVCIPSYELVEGWTRVFKDDHHPDLHWGGSKHIWRVAVASSAAPTYFPAMQIDDVDSHIDGGIWANNPIVVAISEAIRYFNQSLENISVLSLGTGSLSMRINHDKAKKLGIFGWAYRARLLDLVLQAQSKGAHNTACMLLHPDKYMRIDADLNIHIALDSYESAYDLIERGKQAGRMNKTRIEQKFMQLPRQPKPSN